MEDSESDFGASIRRAVYALWSGNIGRAGFLEQIESTIDRGLRQAWRQGMADVGLLPEDMTSEEELEIGKIVLEQFGYTGGFADFIEAGSKANGGKLASLQYRASLWVNQYNRVRNRAKLMAQNDPPLTWVEGDTIEKCVDCLYANGKTYRASIWKKWGWEEPGTPDITRCKGWGCHCFFSPAVPGTPLSKGHPRRPLGPE